MTLSVENATDLVLHAWRQEWGPEETAEALRIAGAERKTILAALEKARMRLTGSPRFDSGVAL